MSVDQPESIILLGTENPVALPVIRALGSGFPGMPLYALSRKNHQTYLPQYSRFLRSHNYLESTTEEDLFQEITDRINGDRSTILLPVDEFFVRTLSSLKNRLETFAYLPPLPDLDIFDSLVYKNQLGKLLVRFGFPCAETYSLEEVDLSCIENDFFPCLLKPVRGSSGNGIEKITDKDMLGNRMLNLEKNKYIIQEIIPGINMDCSLLAINGTIKALTIQKGLENVRFMFSTAIKFEHNQRVLGIVQKLMEKTYYSGLAHLDFRLDQRDNAPKLIDFNARFWHSLLGSKAAGVDFTLLSCFTAMGIPFEQPAFKESTYLMGKSTFDHYQKRFVRLFSSPGTGSVFTDIWDRVQDPLPEIMRLFR